MCMARSFVWPGSCVVFFLSRWHEQAGGCGSSGSIDNFGHLATFGLMLSPRDTYPSSDGSTPWCPCSWDSFPPPPHVNPANIKIQNFWFWVARDTVSWSGAGKHSIDPSVSCRIFFRWILVSALLLLGMPFCRDCLLACCAVNRSRLFVPSGQMLDGLGTLAHPKSFLPD